MITLYGIGDIFEGGHGETKDLRVQWALEEVGLEYRFHALDQTAGDLDRDSYARLSPFHQVPVIDDDGFVIAESAAILLYVAEKAGRLIPSDGDDDEPTHRLRPFHPSRCNARHIRRIR